VENQHEKNEHLLRKLGKKKLYLALAKNDYEKLVSISKIRTQIVFSKSPDTLAQASRSTSIIAVDQLLEKRMQKMQSKIVLNLNS